MNCIPRKVSYSNELIWEVDHCLIHREDGPAIIKDNGLKFWYLMDRRMPQKDWFRELLSIKLSPFVNQRREIIFELNSEISANLDDILTEYEIMFGFGNQKLKITIEPIK